MVRLSASIIYNKQNVLLILLLNQPFTYNITTIYNCSLVLLCTRKMMLISVLLTSVLFWGHASLKCIILKQGQCKDKDETCTVNLKLQQVFYFNTILF